MSSLWLLLGGDASSCCCIVVAVVVDSVVADSRVLTSCDGLLSLSLSVALGVTVPVRVVLITRGALAIKGGMPRPIGGSERRNGVNALICGASESESFLPPELLLPSLRLKTVIPPAETVVVEVIVETEAEDSMKGESTCGAVGEVGDIGLGGVSEGHGIGTVCGADSGLSEFGDSSALELGKDVDGESGAPPKGPPGIIRCARGGGEYMAGCDDGEKGESGIAC